MRLKDHPEVKIFFQDSTRAAAGDRNAKEQIEQIWQYWYRAQAESVKLGFPTTRSVELDGRSGESSFGEMINRDGSHDYGYVAAIKGDSNASTDTPNLVLTVIRTAAQAKGKPISDKELKDMAQKIAASIKHR